MKTYFVMLNVQVEIKQQYSVTCLSNSCTRCACAFKL